MKHYLHFVSQIVVKLLSVGSDSTMTTWGIVLIGTYWKRRRYISLTHLASASIASQYLQTNILECPWSSSVLGLSNPILYWYILLRVIKLWKVKYEGRSNIQISNTMLSVGIYNLICIFYILYIIFPFLYYIQEVSNTKLFVI